MASGLLALGLTSCSFSTDQGVTDLRAKEQRDKVDAELKKTEGFYAGDLRFSDGRVVPVELRLFVIPVPDGTDSKGSPRTAPALCGQYMQSDRLTPDVLLEGSYTSETGELRLSSKLARCGSEAEGALKVDFRGSFTGSSIAGEMTVRSTELSIQRGSMQIPLLSRDIDTPTSGRQNLAERLRREFLPLVGTYLIEILPNPEQAAPSTACLNLFIREKSTDSASSGGSRGGSAGSSAGVSLPELAGTYLDAVADAGWSNRVEYITYREPREINFNVSSAGGAIIVSARGKITGPGQFRGTISYPSYSGEFRATRVNTGCSR